jgi:hypothetical protein
MKTASSNQQDCRIAEGVGLQKPSCVEVEKTGSQLEQLSLLRLTARNP